MASDGPAVSEADRIAELEAEVERLRDREVSVRHQRSRIMSDVMRRHSHGQLIEHWVGQRHGLVDESATGPAFGTLHVRDPHAPPHLTEPTTSRGRYLNGRTRDAGPGSYLGLALCVLPLMADELWVGARGILEHAYNHERNAGLCGCVALCGMCSYLTGQPTIAAAWQAAR